MAAVLHLLVLSAFALAPGAAAQGGADAAKAWEQYYLEDVKKPFFSHDGRGRYDAQRPGASPARFRQPKRERTLRVFVVGGSIAQRHMSFPDHLGERLRRALGGRVEVLGCGMGGYDSEREAAVVAEVLGYSPDLIVLMTGHNENIVVRRPWFQRAVDPAPGPERFAANLRRMVQAARSRGVPVVVMTPPLNWSDQAPESASFPADPAFIDGWLHYVRGDSRAAAAAWRRPPASERGADQDAAALFYLARAEERLEDIASANLHYERSRLAAERPRFCGQACREAISRAGQEDGVLWVDVDAVFRAAAAPRLPGLEMFQDAVHWGARYNPLVSEAILGALRAAPAFAHLPWKPGYRPKTPRWSPEAEDEDLLNTLRYALAEIGAKPEPSLSALSRIAWGLRNRPSTFKDPIKLYAKLLKFKNMGRAWKMQPSFGSASRWLWLVGIARLELGDPQGARRAFSQAAKLEPSFAPLRTWQAVAAALSHDDAAARELLAQDGAEDPRYAALWKKALGL